MLVSTFAFVINGWIFIIMISLELVASVLNLTISFIFVRDNLGYIYATLQDRNAELIQWLHKMLIMITYKIYLAIINQ